MTEKETPTFGDEIRALREARGLSMRDAATKSGEISQTGWLRIEKDARQNPKLSTLIGIAQALHIEVTIDPEGVAIQELDERTGVVCQTCGAHQTIWDKDKWEDDGGEWYCPDHRSDVIG